MGAQPEKFRLLIPDADIADLRERLLRTRFPDQCPGEPWAYGADLSYLRSLIEYWRGLVFFRAEKASLVAVFLYKKSPPRICIYFFFPASHRTETPTPPPPPGWARSG